MKLIKNRNYLLLRSGWSISALGTQLQSFAFSLYVLKMTGSAISFSATLSMQIIPAILFAPFSGYFSDRFNRKTQIILYDALSTGTVCVFLFLYLQNGLLSMWQINLCVFLLSAIGAFNNAVSGCLIQSAVNPEDYMRQKSIDSSISSLITIVAPALAGLLYGISGISTVLIINCISFLVSCVAEIMLKLPRQALCPVVEKSDSMLKLIKEGLSFIRTNSFLPTFLIVLALLNFILSGIEVGLTVISQNLMRLSPTVIGAEESALSVGVLVGALLCGAMNKKMSKMDFQRIIFLDLLATAVPLFLVAIWLRFTYHFFPTAGNIILFVLFNFMVVVANSVLSVNLNARFQREVPNSVMGRVGASVSAILTVCVPVGQVTAGLLLGVLPYFITYLVEGFLCVMLLMGSILHKKYTAGVQSIN